MYIALVASLLVAGSVYSLSMYSLTWWLRSARATKQMVLAYVYANVHGLHSWSMFYMYMPAWWQQYNSALVAYLCTA